MELINTIREIAKILYYEDNSSDRKCTIELPERLLMQFQKEMVEEQVKSGFIASANNEQSTSSSLGFDSVISPKIGGQVTVIESDRFAIYKS